MSNFQEFQKMANDRPIELKQAKSEGKKIVQYIGRYVPEEMIYAAGAEPFYMNKGGEPEPPDAVLEDMLRFMNPYARSLAGYHLMGLDPITPLSDLIVAQQLDNHIGRISELMEYHGLSLYKMGVPAEWEKDFARKYYLKSITRLKGKLEELTGNTISNEALKAEVEKTNKIHDLLRKIDVLRKEDKPVVGGLDFIKMNHASLRVSPDQAIEQLEKIYADLQKAEPIEGSGPRILIAGHIVADGDYAVPGLIEEAGGKIVADMLDDGARWYRWDTPTDGDMLENLKQARYVDKTPNNLFQPGWATRLEDLKTIIDEYKIDAVIWYQLSFDEIYDMEYAVISKKLDNSIPMLKLESSYEYSRESMGPLQTRIESFIESVKEGK